MEPIFATAAVYLAVAFQAAREHAVPAEPRNGMGQLALAREVLLAGLLWPAEFWRAAKRDWDRHFLD